MRTSRIIEIESYIFEREAVSLEELCKKYGVSMSTLRRDLMALQQKGSVKKVYGGVQKAAGSSLIPFNTRSDIQQMAKNKICELACRMVEEKDVIFIDSGSTVCNLIDCLGTLNEVVVITNNLDVILRAMPYPKIKLFVLPGALNRDNNSFSPVNSDNFLQGYNIKKAFMAASGVSLSNQVSHSDPLESVTKRAAIKRAEALYLLVDHTKFDHNSVHNYGRLTDFKCVITDRAPPDPYVSFLESNGIRLIYE